MTFEMVDPAEREGWDRAILRLKEPSIFHSAAWAKVLSRSYGYRPRYQVRLEHGEIAGLLPVLEVRSLATGCRGVSLAFSDFCEPIARDAATFDELLGRAVDYGRGAGWRYLELRGGERFLPGVPPFASYVGNRVDLSEGEPALWRRFSGNTRRNIEKAVAQGVVTTRSRSLEAVREFYRLHCLTRKRHGVPPQPLCFFENLHRFLIEPGLGTVVLAAHQGRPVAGGLYLCFGATLLYKFGASTLEDRNLRANNLVMWDAIRWGIENGAGVLSLGRTDCGDEGLRRFKRGWGGTESVISYYRYDLKDGCYREPLPPGGGGRRVLNRLPVALLRCIGAICYRHVG
ncbi:lipid II:glycine glycyltransferase FemX [Geomesophilobacter sediminis]|uniref:GNAT family N-acetyltransferase n=1 Tax=Geomesophilobacter sediminis TaxID=2798584 RepID=A0A8J7J7N6_9BACT|nr:GNAT family N-acetyltransferase [Geomesophilobacter sediminis]MBJ6725351.1 GNAT family N-acetyltransferase [Geomesophilobacter sediminis]